MLELSKSQKEIRKAALDFAKGEFDKETSFEMEKKREFPKKLLMKAAELGFIGVHFDEAYLGGGLGQLENCLIAEAFCTRDSTVGKALTMTGYASDCLLRFGSDELKEKYLTPIADGELFCGAGFAEPAKGTDLPAMETTSVMKDDVWIINGKKANVTNGGNAGVYIVLCQNGPDPAQAEGLNMFLVDAQAQGLRVIDSGKKIGNNLIATAQIDFDDVQVPASHLLGTQGKGYQQVQQYFIESRLVSAAQAVGIAQGALDRCLAYVKEREQFGRKIARFQITRHKLADMATKIELARLATYQAATVFDTGDRKNTELSAMAKMFASRAAVEVADEAIQLLGGYGYICEYELERYYRDAKSIELFEETSSSQKDLIADKIIGKLK